MITEAVKNDVTFTIRQNGAKYGRHANNTEIGEKVSIAGHG